MDLQMHDCAVLLSAIPLTATSRKDSKSNSVFAKLTPTGGKSSNANSAQANNRTFQDTLQKNFRTFVEEGNEDLVVLGPNEAMFSKVGLVAQPETTDKSASQALGAEQQQNTAGTKDTTHGVFHQDSAPSLIRGPVSPGPNSTTTAGGESRFSEEDGAGDSTDYLVDVVHLRTSKPTIIAAKRLNLPGNEKRSLIAVQHEEQYVHFYSIDEVNERGQAVNGGYSDKWTKTTGLTESFAVFHSMIRTGTFGGKSLAAIRYFCWIPEYSAVAKSQGYDGFCLIVTEGNINIVAVSSKTNTKSSDHKPTNVISSVNTRCDYVEYLPRRRFLLAINSTRSSIVKCFFIDLPVAEGIRKLTELKVESDSGVVPNTAAVSGSLIGTVTTVGNGMTPHRGDRLVVPVVLYDNVYIADAVPSRSEIHLYVWQAPRSTSAIDLANSVQKKYVLPVSDTVWPIQIVTVDNLLIVQQQEQGNLCHVYDIKLLPPDLLVQEFGEKALRGRQPLAVSTIKTNIQRTKDKTKKQMHQDPHAGGGGTGSQKEAPLMPEDADEPQGAVGALGSAVGTATTAVGSAASVTTQQIGAWSGAAMSMASNAASAAWSAMFPVSWGTSFGNTPSEGGVYFVRPALIPLPIEMESRPAGGRSNNNGGGGGGGRYHPTGNVSNLSALTQQHNSFSSASDKTAAPGTVQPGSFNSGVKSTAITGEIELYRGRNLPLALNRATGEVFLVLINPTGLASVFGDRCLGVHFLLNRTGLGGDVVPTLLREMTLRREPLHTIGVLFGQISTQSYYHRLKLQQERQRGNIGTASGTSSSNQLNTVAPSQRAPPKPYGKAQNRIHRKAGMDSKRLYETFPLADVQQQADWDFFRYEDALWYYRGPSAVGANSEASAAAPTAAATSVSEEVAADATNGGAVSSSEQFAKQKQNSSYVVVGVDEGPANDTTMAHQEKETSLENPNSVNVAGRPGALTAPPPCFDQKQMCRYVFFPLVEYGTSLQQRMEEDKSLVDEAKEFYQFFLFTLLEYCRSLRQHAQLFSHTLQSTLIDAFLVLSNLGIPQYYRLQQLLMYRGIDSHVSIALKLVRLADHYPPAFQHALDMLWRLKEYTKIVDVLLAKNLPLRAANFAFENKVRGISVTEILRCAISAEEGAKKKVAHDRSHYESSAAYSSPRRSMSPRGSALVGGAGGGSPVVAGNNFQIEECNCGALGTFTTVYSLMMRYIECIQEENPTSTRQSLLLPTDQQLAPFKKLIDENASARPSAILW